MGATGHVVSGGGGGGPHTHPWSEITGEPSEFPAEAHGHAWADVTGKPSTFPPEAHAHVITDTVGLQAALDAKSDSSHTHGEGGGSTAWTDITGKPVVFPPDLHDHVVADVAGLQAALDAKSGTGHVHGISDVTNLQALLDAKAAVSHLHAIGDVTGLQTALDSKSGTSHTHSAPSWTDVTGKPTEFTPSAHSHAVADTTGLQAALDAKAASTHSHAIADVTALQTALDAKAPLVSPALTGNPTAPTQSPGNNSTRIATTAYVEAAVAAGGGGGGGGAGLPNSIYPIATRWSPFPPGRIGSNRTMELGRGFLAPLPMAAVGTLDQLAMEVATAGAAGATVRAILWSANTDRSPNVSFRDLGTVATDSTGVKTWTGIAEALAANTLYWVCVAAQTATCGARAIAAYNSYIFDSAAFSGTGETSHLSMTGLTGAVANGTAFVFNSSENGPRLSARFS